GYQMLGRALRDPDSVESEVGELPGLALLPVETTFADSKATHRVRARVAGGPGWMGGVTGTLLEGYEIHMGRTTTPAHWLELPGRGWDGAGSRAGKVWGCYLHGLFANDAFRRAWLRSLRPDFQAAPLSDAARLQHNLDHLADALAEALPIARLEQIIQEG